MPQDYELLEPVQDYDVLEPAASSELDYEVLTPASDPLEAKKSTLRAEKRAVANSYSEHVADAVLGTLALPGKALTGLDDLIGVRRPPEQFAYMPFAQDPDFADQPPEALARLQEMKDRMALGERIRRVESPASTGLRESAIGGVEALTKPSGIAIAAGATVAPTVMGPVLAGMGIEGTKDAWRRIQEARTSGDRAEYYRALGDLTQTLPMVVGGARMTALPSRNTVRPVEERPPAEPLQEVPVEPLELRPPAEPAAVPETLASVAEPAAAVPKEAAAVSKAEQDAIRAQLAEEHPGISGEVDAPPTPTDVGPGMGAMAAGELTPTPRPATSNKIAVVDAERAQRGQPPMEPAIRESYGQWLDEANAKIEADPLWQDRLIAELRAKPRAATPVENAALLQRRVDLQNEVAKAMREGVEAMDDGRIEDAASAEVRYQEWSEKLSQLEEATSRGGAGTEAGRSLAALKMMMREDFSLAALEQRRRAARGFEPLTADERAELVRLHDRAEKARVAAEAALALAEKRIADLEAAAAKSGRKPARKPRPAEETKEVVDARVKEEDAKAAIDKVIADDIAARLPLRKKIWRGIQMTRDSFGNLVSAYDFSGPRQALGAILANTTRVVTNPRSTYALMLRPFGRMFQGWASEVVAKRLERRRQLRPNAKSGADKISEVEYTSLDNVNRTKREENAHSIIDAWAKLPLRTGNAVKSTVTAPIKLASRGVRMSNRAFTTFLNETKAELLDHLLRINYKESAPTPNQLRIIGNLVNVATGRGKLSPTTAKVAANILWSPKLLASRIQTLIGQPLWTGEWAGSAKARGIVAREYARQIAGGYLLYKVSRLFTDKDEDDITSSDAGKIVRGNTRIDLWGGYQQVTVVGARTATGTTTTLKGQERDISASRKYGQRGIWYVLADFGRSKLRPDLAAATDILTRETGPNRVPTTPGSVAETLLVPLPMRDITGILEEHGFTEGMIIEALGQFGAGVSQYEDVERQR